MLIGTLVSLLGLVPGTAGAFTAKVVNSTNSAGAAASFKCQDTFASTGNVGNAYFEYQLTSTTATETDRSTSVSAGTYAGTHTTAAATVSDACPRDNTVAPNLWSLNGTSSVLTNATSITAPTTFSLAVWIRTNVVSRPIMGLGTSATGVNSAWDRTLSLNSSGQAVFTIFRNGSQTTTVSSTASVTDNNWHQLVATLSTASMMRIYVDGVLVAGPTSTTTIATTNYWRIGSDGMSTPAFFSGRMRFAAAYKFELVASEIAAEYRNGT